MPKLDLHTHSIASPDGALTVRDYKRLLRTGRLDAIAVTDHETIEFAVKLRQELGNKIIVGEEIKTTEGEIIGLFLSKRVAPRLSPEETIRQIRQQDGLVYIPHPFETVRQGMPLATLERIANDVDIIETRNGRAYFQDNSTLAATWAQRHGTAQAASSDAHGRIGWGHTYSEIDDLPTRNNLVNQLSNARYATRRVGFIGTLYPKLNRLKKRLGHG